MCNWMYTIEGVKDNRSRPELIYCLIQWFPPLWTDFGSVRSKLIWPTFISILLQASSLESASDMADGFNICRIFLHMSGRYK